MDLALGAATVAVSRAGASSLAELAAMRVPSVLIPFPAATDNHQYFNARAFTESGAALMLEQKEATPELLVRLVSKLIAETAAREKMQAALTQWHAPRAAEEIAGKILSAIGRSADNHVRANEPISETRGQDCPRSDATERKEFSAA